ncbi:helix-turn-helix domain-containing protein [Qipengyuania sp. NPDC077410]|uniref:helix-turn-helix domain-containing protein n=1 Tax=Qipengyuania sp. NPDC077410 TaxID=3364496 RepID=UPI0037C8C785
MPALFNSENLKQFRKQRHISRAELAKFLGTSLERVQEFERGDRNPTALQSDRIADLLGLSIGHLYGESNHEIEDDLVDFRTRNLAPARLSANGLKKVVRAERHAKFTKFLMIELKDNFVPAFPRLTGDLTQDFASELRSRFDDWRLRAETKEQIGGAPEVQFLHWLRIFTELQGAVTAVHDAPEKDFWGFYTDAGVDLPSIFINRSIQSKKSQLFTFCHEMAHYIEDAEGISNPYSAKNAIERRCNSFSAEFLAPENVFGEFVVGLGRTIRSDPSAMIENASRGSLLSRQATAMRLKELGYLKKTDYSEWFRSNKRWYKEDKKIETDSAVVIPNIHHAKQIGEVGYLPVYLAGLAVSRKIIDSFDVESALGISRAFQTKAFALARRRVEAMLDDAA